MVPNDAEVERHVGSRDRDRGREHTLADAVREQEGDHDRDQEVRKREQGVHDQHECAVERAAVVAGQEAERNADGERHHERDQNHLELGLGAVDDPRHHVGGLHGRSHQVGVRRRRELGEAMPVRLVLVERIRRDDRREQREHDEEEGDRGTRPEHRPGEAASLPDGLERAAHRRQEALAARMSPRGHQYRILGSMYAFRKSMRTLIATTTSAKTTMMPCTAV